MNIGLHPNDNNFENIKYRCQYQHHFCMKHTFDYDPGGKTTEINFFLQKYKNI